MDQQDTQSIIDNLKSQITDKNILLDKYENLIERIKEIINDNKHDLENDFYDHKSYRDMIWDLYSMVCCDKTINK